MTDLFTVRIWWNDAKNVWWAEGDDFPGLMVEGASVEDLMATLHGAIRRRLGVGSEVADRDLPLYYEVMVPDETEDGI